MIVVIFPGKGHKVPVRLDGEDAVEVNRVCAVPIKAVRVVR